MNEELCAAEGILARRRRVPLILAAGIVVLAAGVTYLVTGPWFSRAAPSTKPLRVVITDTSAKELGCSCAPGAPRRSYELLRQAVQAQLSRPVQFNYLADFLFDDVPKEQEGLLRAADLIIGKNSAIEHVARQKGFGLNRIASLTRPDGRTGLRGVFVARISDGIRNLGDVEGRTVCFGMPFHAEKHDAAWAALRKIGVRPGKTEQALLCRDAVIELACGKADIAVISDYSVGLLDLEEVTRGVKLGIVGQTDAVSYLSVFASDRLSEDERQSIQRVLLDAAANPELLDALKSKSGFVAPADATRPSTQSPADDQDKSAGAFR